MKNIFSRFLLLMLLLPLPSQGAEDNAAPQETIESGMADETDTQATKPPAIATADMLEQQKQADLAALQPPETEIFWLDVAEQKRLALYLASVEPEPHAGIIIFPDTTTSADWPDFIHPLRTALTEHGWSTLALNLPPEADPLIPQRTLPSRQGSNTLQQNNNAAETDSETPTETPAADTAEATAADTETDNTIKNDSGVKDDNTASAETSQPGYSEIIGELSSAAMQVMTEKGHEKQIIMGIGTGAVWAMQYFIAADNDSQYLVLVDPRNSSTADAPLLTTLIAEIDTPVLDLWLDSNAQIRQQAALRKRTASRNKDTDYTQIRINRRVDAVGKQPQWLTKQVRGILESRILKAMQAEPSEPVVDSQLTPGA